MLATAALLLATASPAAIACPVASIGFAPPLGTPLQLTRRTERALGSGTFTRVIRYRITFARAGRGYAMRWQQTGSTASGPPELLRLLSLQEDSAQGETLDFTLDETGALLGVTEADDATERLASAIARLRSDPAVAARPQSERAMIGEMLDRIAAMPAAERAALHMGRAERLLLFAGQQCADGSITGRDGAAYRIVTEASPDTGLALTTLSSEQRSDGATITSRNNVVLATATGLAGAHAQVTRVAVGESIRDSREWLELAPEVQPEGNPGEG